MIRYMERYRYPDSIQYRVDQVWDIIAGMTSPQINDHAVSNYDSTRAKICFYIAVKKFRKWPHKIKERLNWISDGSRKDVVDKEEKRN